MTFRFIHTADWQIGKPFARFPSGLAGELAAARLAAIERIAAIARARGAAHVLVAGDVFDSENLAKVDLRRAFERLTEHPDITWLLLPGNHDPARIGGLWDRVNAIGLPPNITALSAPAPLDIARDITVLPAPLTTKSPGRDPTAWMDGAATADGVARIGLAHGSVQGFGSMGESAVEIAPDRVARAGLAYLALGDWHGTHSVSRHTWYAGTPEPDRFADNAPGHVLAVTLEGTRLVSVEPVASATFTWMRHEAALATARDLAQIERAIEERATPLRTMLVRLAVSGSLSLTDRAELDAWQERWSAKLSHLEIDARDLAARPDKSDFETLAASPGLADAARELDRLVAQSPAAEQRALAATALMRLHGFAAEAAREGDA